MGIITWILFGLIAGAIAKMIMPGSQGGGWLITIILGILGAFVGGYRCLRSPLGRCYLILESEKLDSCHWRSFNYPLDLRNGHKEELM